MDKLFCCAFALVVIGSRGLEFSLSHNAADTSDNRHQCGLLMCVESYTDADNSSVTQSEGDTIETADQQTVATISSLKVFKVETDIHSGNSRDKTRRLIASVTSQQSRLSRVSNGITIDGRLEAQWATLRLELAKQNDCQAEYVCESRAVGVQGNKLLSSSRILLQSGQSNDHGSEVSWTPQVTMQVLALVQQLDTKFEFLSSSVEKLEQDTQSLKADLNTKSNRLEDRILSQSDRLEDKIESFKNRMEDNMKGFERTLTDDNTNKLLSHSSGSGESFETQVKTNLLSLDNKLSAVKSNLAQLETSLETNIGDSCKKLNQKLETLKKKEELSVQNLILKIQNTTCEGADKLSVAVTEGFTSLEKSLQNKLEDLSSDVNVSVIETRALVRQSALHVQANLTFTKELTSALTDVLTPKNCYKGMKVSASASTPYTVINPGQNNTLGFPFLCDTFTDGGGWIVIQRRTTGDVDFYRGWRDYKNGFGSIYGDFWLGNEKIHALSTSGTLELRVDLKYKDKSAYAHYGTFSIGDEASNYALHVGQYEGTAGDSLLAYHGGMQFSTYDRDNDKWGKNCAVEFLGAWWHKDCHTSNLNGKWMANANKGPRWRTMSGDYAASYTEMKVRL